MTALICGSLAYDTIMVFPERFKDHILPDKVHILNVAFLVPELRREFGGVAGNIAFNLRMLGGDPVPMGMVGRDFEPYREWLIEHEIRLDCVHVLDDEYTAQAYITTDKDDNQITAFHPGAMSGSHQNTIESAGKVDIALLGPDGREGMIEHAEDCAKLGVPFIFDPGQALPMFNGEELKRFIELADWVCVNDYESQMLEQRTGWSADEIAGKVRAYFVTLGAKGCRVITTGEQFDIPAVEPAQVVDPTGCGDAFRGGLLYGLTRDMDLRTAVQIGTLLGSIKIAQPGTQNHAVSLEDFEQRYQQAFGSPLKLGQ